MAPRNSGGNSKAPPPPVAAPPPVVFPPEASAPPGGWTTGLCGCFDNPLNCLITCFCPCITFGQNAEIIDRGGTSCACAGLTCCLIFHCFGCTYWYTCTYRTKLRGHHSIPGGECADCCLHYWCELCAICQEYRELKNRGFDPSIGWAANAERMSRPVGVTVPPSIPGGMVR
ncbi:protein PLANT CADMIUM RESISTANCE 2-like [Syzygium oleosum]|uniref:protein PLANT CADMIUM RESISTANCE 2-like n=1 Tax=Syzygium oleosum TaxID=219896 RepID=UPI0024BBA342|nr:protein PLANT CADMIUM RESISTANCE 2-like [Syzygium oleosum]